MNPRLKRTFKGLAKSWSANFSMLVIMLGGLEHYSGTLTLLFGAKTNGRAMADWGVATAMAGSRECSLAEDHWATKGTVALTGVFLACLAVYYFANWKALADVWPVR